MTRGTVLAVAGCKGGVGKTTTAINVGTAAARDRSAVVVETDLAASNVCDFLDVGCHPEGDPTLHDVLADDASIEEATYDAPGGASVIPSGATIEGFADVDAERVAGVVETLRARYDLVVLDTPAGLSVETLQPMAVADGVVLVSTPRLSSVRDVKKTAELAERVGGDAVGLVLTRTGTGSAPPAENLARFLEVDLLGEVPDDQAVPRSQDAGRPVVDFDPEAPAARAYEAVVDGLLDDRQAERVAGGGT